MSQHVGESCGVAKKMEALVRTPPSQATKEVCTCILLPCSAIDVTECLMNTTMDIRKCHLISKVITHSLISY